jgi:hypothetical protein
MSAVYRWAARGLWGIRLETLKIGAISHTSTEAVGRFIEAITRVSDQSKTSEGDIGDGKISQELERLGI